MMKRNIQIFKLLIVSVTIVLAAAACGAGNSGDENKSPKAPQAVEIETPPMPDIS